MSEQTVTTTPDPQPEGRVQGEPPVPPTSLRSDSDPRMFTAEDLEKARQQEKDKVYKRMETMNETISRLEAESNARQQAEADAQRTAAEQAEKERVESLSIRDLLAEREAAWQAESAALRQEIETERALRERETQFAELMDERQRIIQSYSDRVAPELLDLIGGETPEQIHQSAEDMAARTESILAQTAEAMQNARQQIPTARVTAPASGDNSGANRQYTPDDVRNMSMAEYAKHRQSLLGGGAGGTRNRGLFG